MLTSKNSITVKIVHDGKVVEFEGDIESVWRSVNKYLSEKLGPVDLVAKLTGAVDINMLAEKLVGRVVIQNNEINVVEQADSKVRILLCLAAAYVGKKLGLYDEDFLSPKKIASIVKMGENAVRARLSELWRNGLVNKDPEGRYAFNPSTGLKILETMK